MPGHRTHVRIRIRTHVGKEPSDYVGTHGRFDGRTCVRMHDRTHIITKVGPCVTTLFAAHARLDAGAHVGDTC